MTFPGAARYWAIRNSCWDLLAPGIPQSTDWPELRRLGVQYPLIHCEHIREQEFQGCLQKTGDADRCLKRQLDLLKNKNTYDTQEFTGRKKLTAQEFFPEAPQMRPQTKNQELLVDLVGSLYGEGESGWDEFEKELESNFREPIRETCREVIPGAKRFPMPVDAQEALLRCEDRYAKEFKACEDAAIGHTDDPIEKLYDRRDRLKDLPSTPSRKKSLAKLKSQIAALDDERTAAFKDCLFKTQSRMRGPRALNGVAPQTAVGTKIALAGAALGLGWALLARR